MRHREETQLREEIQRLKRLLAAANPVVPSWAAMTAVLHLPPEALEKMHQLTLAAQTTTVQSPRGTGYTETMRNSKPDDQDHGSEERGDDMKHIHRVAAALPLDSEDEKTVDALTSNLSTRPLQRLTGTISRLDLDAGQVSVKFSAPEAVLRRLAALMWHGTEVTATFPLEGDAEKT